ncbi:type I restriction-modification system subunit M [Alphaproteobacteria bacterium]|nr:type I restriction-modification system subunit M [Alphaproteobacteria bacterium]
MNSQELSQKVYRFCHTLRDDGVNSGEYLEQLTYLIFLKMAHEFAQPPHDRDFGVPRNYQWTELTSKRGSELANFYKTLLHELGSSAGVLGQIYLDAENRIKDPAKLYSIITMIDETQWTNGYTDVLGGIYEDLLERNAADTKTGAGQYFTPRSLITAMVECLRPEPNKTIADPSCGSGGFFLAAYNYIVKTHGDMLDKEQKAFLKHQTFHGNEIVPNTRRQCLMNLYLHNIGDLAGEVLISGNDALTVAAPRTYDYVLANPPFGKKSSMTITNSDGTQDTEDLTYNRQDFWTTTSNKQLNFVQHIKTMLKTNGAAAIVVPDNVLFEGGAGEIVRKQLLQTSDVHTILRLPTGIFYSAGVKANVVFLQNHEASADPWTKGIWYYDYRTNIHHTLKQKPMTRADLEEFVTCYNPDNRFERSETWHEDTNPEGRWRKYSYEEIMARDKTSLDIFWLKDKSLTDLDALPSPDILAAEIVDNLQAALNSFNEVAESLNEPHD